jgi:hypothetical protein
VTRVGPRFRAGWSADVGFWESVAVGLLVAAAGGSFAWLRHSTNRDRLLDGVRHRVQTTACDHQWQPLDHEWEGVRVTFHEECVKCGAVKTTPDPKRAKFRWPWQR